MVEGTVGIDNGDEILEEYIRTVKPASGQKVGDRFVIHVINQQYGENRVQRTVVTPIDDDRRGYEELPENEFDRSDRKFLAVAVAASAVVLNAMDSDWHEHADLMDELEVEVEQLCPQHAFKDR